jgi:hypothetical protein
MLAGGTRLIDSLIAELEVHNTIYKTNRGLNPDKSVRIQPFSYLMLIMNVRTLLLKDIKFIVHVILNLFQDLQLMLRRDAETSSA